MKTNRSISLDREIYDLIEEYMIRKRMYNFSRAVSTLIKDSFRWQKIALDMQGVDVSDIPEVGLDIPMRDS